jgi:hypothetical protein
MGGILDFEMAFCSGGSLTSSNIYVDQYLTDLLSVKKTVGVEKTFIRDRL